MNYRENLDPTPPFPPKKQTPVAFNGSELSGKRDLSRINYVD